MTTLLDNLSRLVWLHNATGGGDPLAQIANGPGYILVVGRELSETGYLSGRWGYMVQWALKIRPVADVDVLYTDSGITHSTEPSRNREAAKWAARQEWRKELERIGADVTRWAEKITGLVDAGLTDDALQDAADEWWQGEQDD
jgi:hypothetical protein